MFLCFLCTFSFLFSFLEEMTSILLQEHLLATLSVINFCIWCYFIALGILAAVYECLHSVYDMITTIYSVIASTYLAVLSRAVIPSVHSQALIIKRTVDSENLIVLQNAFNRDKLLLKQLP